MAKICYYLAISLDGFLARTDGSVDWLDNYMDPLETPYDYQPFYKTVNGVVMGRKTFEKILSYGEYPYKNKPGLVLSRNENFTTTEPDILAATKDWQQQVEKLSSSISGRLWLVGGGEIANLFINNDLLDEIIITIIPETIGTGLPWLGNQELSAKWKLSEQYTAKNGIVQLAYLKQA